MKCEKCGVILHFPKSWYYGCYICGFPLDFSYEIKRIRCKFTPEEIKILLKQLKPNGVDSLKSRLKKCNFIP